MTDVAEWLCNPPEIRRRFYQLRAHIGRHPSHVDHWNPYWRQCFTPMLDKRVFDALNFTEDGVHTTPDFCFMGCLDAPDEIPLGGTINVQTIGGWTREEYLRAPRDSDDWKARARAQNETAKMLKQILEEADK